MKKVFVLLMISSFVVGAEPVNINRADAEVISQGL